jgi:hypothetical protein
MYSLSIDYFEVVIEGALSCAKTRVLICRLVYSLSAIKWNYNKAICGLGFSSLKNPDSLQDLFTVEKGLKAFDVN